MEKPSLPAVVPDASKLGLDHDRLLSIKQLRAIALLLTGHGVEVIAEEVGVHYNTVYGWCRGEKFRKKFDDAASKLLDAYMTMAKTRMLRMLSILEEVATDPNQKPSDRVNAASKYLDKILKVHEVQTLKKSLAEFMKLKQLLDDGDAHGVARPGEQHRPPEGEAGEAVRGEGPDGRAGPGPAG